MGPILRFLATGCYAGYSPVAPGTVGSLVGLLLYIPLQAVSPLLYGLAILILFGMGVWVSHSSEREFGMADSPRIVIDEIVGMLLTLFLVPVGMAWAVGGFVLFRFFDILKPPPIRWLERRLPGGWGIMTDDVMAAVYANGALQVVAFLAGRWNL
ncbi:MAG: phosphatidylglycerophosphatase A [Nitrospirae bacterium]|nr:phosphatidylglycerophosphatase A [Nitrospirota bacterium]